jgi:MFS family permease
MHGGNGPPALIGTASGLRGRARVLLQHAGFGRLIAAQLLAQCADGIAQAAFAEAVVLDPTTQETPLRILAVFALTLLPYSALAPFLGVFVDRWDRRAVLVWANFGRAVLLVSLPLWAEALPPTVSLYAAVLALLGLGRLFLSTKGAVLPVVLDERDLLEGNAFSGGTGMIAALSGGMIGLAAAALVASPSVFAAAGAIYALSALVARGLPNLSAPRAQVNERLARAFVRVGRELIHGAREVWSRRRARLALAAIFGLRSAVMLTAIAAVLVIKSEYPDPSDRLGRLSAGAIALGTSSVGALLGALFVSWWGRRLGSGRLIVLGFVVSGTGIGVLGGVLDLWAVAALTALSGYGAYIAKIAADAQVQEALSDGYRGRAFSLYDVLYNFASVCAASIMVAFQHASYRAVLVPCGLATLVLGALAWRGMRRAGMIERAGV